MTWPARPALGIKCRLADCDNYASGHILVGTGEKDPVPVPVCKRCMRGMCVLLDMDLNGYSVKP